LTVFGRYGAAKYIRTDNGSNLVASILVSELVKLLGMDRKTTLPYRPQANGQVERAGGEATRHLRAIVFAWRASSSWSIFLPLAQRILNAAVHSSTGASPAAILFGSRIDLNRGLLIPFSNDKEKTIRTSQYVKELVEAQDTMQAASVVHLESVVEKRLEAEREGNTFEKGDACMISYPETQWGRGGAHKLSVLRMGPRIITGKGPFGDTYLVQNLCTGVVNTFDVSRISRYYPAEGESLLDTASLALDEYIVKEIINHKGNQSQKLKMEFLISWEGYEEQTWEPYENIKHTEAFDRYATKMKW